MPPKPNAIATVFLGFLLLTFCHADPGSKCSKKSPLVNLESEFKMLQHQLRGSIKILDNCSFKVSNFDMLSGSDVQWWGAVADFNNLTAGFVVSDHKLNETFKKASFTVRLRDDVTWDQIQVLAVWDLPTSSDFGHVVLRDMKNATFDLSPSPSPASHSGNGSGQVHTEPTMLVNCKGLSDSRRERRSRRKKKKKKTDL